MSEKAVSCEIDATIYQEKTVDKRRRSFVHLFPFYASSLKFEASRPQTGQWKSAGSGSPS